MASVRDGALAALQSVSLDPIAACEAEVVPQWTDRLAGADVFTADHCYKLIESLRID